VTRTFSEFIFSIFNPFPPMLLSLLLSLTPTRPAPILGPLGRPAQAWFLGQVTRHCPEIAQTLHDDSGPKPYTVSTLLDGRGRPLVAGKWLKAGEVCWLRVTTFGEELSKAMLEQILPGLPDRLALYKMEFRVDGYTLDPAQHPWAGQTSFAHLAQAAGLADGRSRQVRLEFASPTAFRSEGADIPLPLPNHIFRGYWQKWNAYAPEPIRVQDIWPQFAAACIQVCELTGINTERWVFAEGTRGAATGFTGTSGFTLLPRHLCGEMGAYWEGAEVVMRTLATFAFYCGTGHHTTIGLGQTRPLPLPISARG
jgi:CRISPR-associated endoribonuclease Cas6